MYAVAEVEIEGLGRQALSGRLMADGRLQHLKARHLLVTPAVVIKRFDTLADLHAEAARTSDFAADRKRVEA